VKEMGEGDVGRAGSGRTKWIAITIVLILAAASLGTYLLFENDDNSTSSYRRYVYWDTEYTDTAWLVKIVEIQTGSLPDINQNEIRLDLVAKPGGLIDGWSFGELNNLTTSNGVRWVDVNNNGYVEIGDYLQINRSGGSNIIINPDLHDLALYGANADLVFYPSPYIYLPPAEILEMSVEKTSDGWNMTVTWVNETIPEQFMEAWNVSFRLENKSGEFLTSYQNDNSFWLGFIRFPLPEYNHVDQGFYNITWYDYDENRIISLNDTFIIYNYSGLVEADYTLRLMSNKYGFGHTIIEIVLV
jgi:hypothetical protein